MRMLCLLNSDAGTIKRAGPEQMADEVAQRLAPDGGEVAVRLVSGPELPAAIDEAGRDAALDALIVGGGDGTISTAVSRLAGTSLALGVLPLGTMNLVARDLGVPLDPMAAVDALAQAEPRRIDLGEANGRLFAHHISLGVHPWMIRHRDRQRERMGLRKWVAMLWAWWRVFIRRPMVRLAYGHAEGGGRMHTPLALIASNPLAQGIGPVPERGSLDQGRLGIYVARPATRFGLLRLSAKVSLGNWHDNPQLQAHTSEDLVLTTRRRYLFASMDGEIVRLETPVRCRVRPGMLTVLAPQQS